MKVEKNHLARAARKIGLTDSQADKLWQALQETESKSSFSITLLYL